MYNTGTLTASRCTFSGNTASGDGGAIANGGALAVAGSTFSSNTAGGDGGAIETTGGTVTITGSLFTGNRTPTGNGGAIASFDPLTITNSVFTANSANTIRGLGGGAIYTESSSVATITNSTFTGNSASILGGGAIFNVGSVTLIGDTLSGNMTTGGSPGGAITNYPNGPQLILMHTVVAGNTAPGATGPDINGSVTDGGGNMVGITDGSTGVAATTDRTGTATAPLNPLLAPLADNGGTGQTFAPLPGSPAINIAACPAGLTVDARGVSRPQPAGGACDAGAFESRGFTGRRRPLQTP